MTELPFRLEVAELPGEVRIRVAGDVSAPDAGTLDDSVSPYMDGPGPGVVIDLEGATYLSSTGLAVLVSLNARARRCGRKLVLMNPNRHLARMLTIANLPVSAPGPAGR